MSEIFFQQDRLTVICGDALESLRQLPDESIQCSVTSPAYWGLRDYGVPGQLGIEKTPEEYTDRLTEICQEVRRVLKKDGTLWINLGDSYVASATGVKREGTGFGAIFNGRDMTGVRASGQRDKTKITGLKPKDLAGIPWLVAFSLRKDGWYLRSDIIWSKSNCMPESVEDRPTRSHEYLFLLSKSKKYYYDHKAIKEPCIYDVDGTQMLARRMRQAGDAKSQPTKERSGIRSGGYKNSAAFNGKNKGAEKQRGHSRRHAGFNDRWDAMEREERCTGMRNKRDVWTVAPANYPEAHFATYPPALITPCILAGSKPGDTILDPFAGSGTTGMVALEYGRRATLIELNPEYCNLIKKRCDVTPGFL